MPPPLLRLQDIPGGHPYMLSLGILGGIYAFENPLQGCLLVRPRLSGGGGRAAGTCPAPLLRTILHQPMHTWPSPSSAVQHSFPTQNPGAQGPILLSLLSVFYNLHSEFMGGGDRAPDGRPQHRLWSLTPNASTARPAGAGTPTAGHAQQLERRPGGDGLTSPERSVSLRVNVPSRRGPAPAGPISEREEYESQVTARDLQQQYQQQQQQQQQRSSPSVSFALGGRHGSLPHLALDSPPTSDGEEAEQEAADSNSAANSFSFLMGGAGKLHDD